MVYKYCVFIQKLDKHLKIGLKFNHRLEFLYLLPKRLLERSSSNKIFLKTNHETEALIL